jgi:plastocyanin
LIVVLPVVLVVVLMGRPSHHLYSYTITKGTAAAVTAGSAVENPLPSDLKVKVGDTLEVTNNDIATHTYTFLVLRPGETGRYTFKRTGIFEATCTVKGHETVIITVT